MFKKLKDKIAEEVKQSPLKTVQQLAQAVVSPSSSSVFEPSSSNDKFCIEEGDIEENENSTSKTSTGGGFTSVTLTGQTSSPARQGSRTVTADTDNFFPVFESQPSNFHVQSDWESASEVEDRGQLEHISKENLYDAYRKVHGRYNKIKNKHHELISHYRQLEREKEKAKTVLTETQDKALLRISELREQCVLEQQAKAHLEEALRNELEEKDHIISSLKTKVQYLKNVGEGSLPENVDINILSEKEVDNLIDFTENSCASKVPLPSVALSNSDSLEWLYQHLTNCNKFLENRTTKIELLKSQLEELKKKNVNTTTSNLGTETPIVNKLFALQNLSQDEQNVYTSLVSIANEFSKETKIVQNNIHNFFLIEDSKNPVNCSSSIGDSHDESFESSLSVSTQGDGCENNGKSVLDVHNEELKKLYKTISDLEMYNKALNQKLIEEKTESQTNLNSLNKTIEFVKTQLRMTNRLFEQGSCNFDNLNPPQVVDNDAVKDLNILVTNFVHTKSELEKLKGFVVNLENELKITRDEVNYLKTKEKSNENCFENESDKLLLKINNDLKEQLEMLENENNNKLAQQESLSIELNDLKKINENLEAQIKETKTLLESSEQLLEKSKTKFNEDAVALEEDKKVLQDKNTKLIVELDDIKSKVSNLLSIKESLSNKILILQKENGYLSTEKENIQLNVEELKNQTEQFEQELLDLKTHNNNFTEENSTLKRDLTNAITEKTTLLENILKLETSVKDVTDALLVSEKKLENVQGDLLSSIEKNDGVCIEQNILQRKIVELENEVEKINRECLKINEDKEVLSQEIASLKQENKSIVAEKKDLNEKINTLVQELDIKVQEYSASLQEKEVLSIGILNLRNEHDLVIADKKSLQLKCEDLMKEMKFVKEELDKSLAINRQMSDEITSLKEEINNFIGENKELQIKIESLENIKSENNECIEETNTLKMTLEGLQNQLKECELQYEKSLSLLKNDVVSLKKDKDESDKEKHTLQVVIDDLNKKIDIKEAEYLKADELKNKLSEELTLSKKEKDTLNSEKDKLLNKLASMEAERDSLSNEILVLKHGIATETNKGIILQEKLDELINESGKIQVNHDSVLQEKNKLSNELVFIREEFEDMVLTLNNTKEQLRNQQQSCDKLNNQLQELSESYKSKCNDVYQQQQENAQLRTDSENLSKQFNEMKTSLETVTNERNELLNNLLVNINTVKIIREMQIEIFSFVRRLKKEITDELNEVRSKISKDLMFQVSNVFKTYEEHCKQIYELQCKSKKDIDLYNSKVKSLQTQIKNADVVTNNNLSFQDNSNLQNKELEDKISELNSNILTYKNRCDDMELSLNRALIIMQSVHGFLIENFMVGSSVLSEQSINAKERELKLRERQISIESFLEDHQTRDWNTTKHSINTLNSDVSGSKNKTLSADVKIHSNVDLKNPIYQPKAIKDEEIIEKDFVQKTNSSKLSGQIDSTSLEMQQLKQEIKLKDDIIKKLQLVIEELEQEKGMFSSKMIQRERKDDVRGVPDQSDSVDATGAGDNGSSPNIDQQIILLEEENKILNDKLETMKQTYEKNIKCLTDDYENKLKVSEEEKEVQKSGKEKKFILNEMKEQIENLQHELDERGDAFEKLYEEHQEIFKSRGEEVRQLRINYEKEMREQDKKWRSCLDRKLAEEELRHKDEVNMLSQGWAAQKKELQTASQLAVSVVESGSNSSDLLRRQVQSLTMQITQLQNERCKCQQRRKSPTPARTIQDCTEMEYLRNILYDYMMGKEPVVLAKVLCALMKFNENQTNNIVIKEEQRLTLFGQLGLL